MTNKAGKTPASPSGAHRESSMPRAPAPRGPDNQTIQALFRRGVVHAKLEVGDIDDPEEHAADRMADRVMRSADGACCTACAGGGSCEEEAVRRAPEGSGGASASVSAGASVRAGLAGGGAPLPKHVRGFFEPRFGRDLGDVRLHTDAAAAASARALGARAYALGPNIAFAVGRYQPDSTAGRHLLAHELAHVVQGGRTPPLRRQTEGEDHIAQFRTQLAADHEQAAIAAARAMTPDETARVLANPSLRMRVRPDRAARLGCLVGPRAHQLQRSFEIFSAASCGQTLPRTRKRPSRFRTFCLFIIGGNCCAKDFYSPKADIHVNASARSENNRSCLRLIFGQEPKPCVIEACSRRGLCEQTLRLNARSRYDELAKALRRQPDVLRQRCEQLLLPGFAPGNKPFPYASRPIIRGGIHQDIAFSIHQA